MADQKVTRRSFLGTTAKAGAALAVAPMIVPRHVLGGVGYQAPSDTLGIAGVGIGGMGKNNIKAVAATEYITALCDVDLGYAAEVFEAYPKAQAYQDYRRMFDEMGDQIDGVIIATPDHMHAMVAMEAMERGKPVYVQKPLTWSVAEARALSDAAERTGVVTQMGNQGHSSDDARLVNEYIRSGRIGTVEHVDVWTNRPIWPQGIEMPETLKRKPETLDWDLYLGPSPDIAYDPAFHPFSWRGWTPWGTGALGDMGAHLIDHPYWAFELTAPKSVETSSSAFNGDSYPSASITHYDFAAQGDRPALQITWHDGGLQPAHPKLLPASETLKPEGGVLYHGSEGILIHDTYGGNPRLYPEELNDPAPEQTFERVKDEKHEQNWVGAIKGTTEAVSPFSYAAPLTETMLLGIVSLKAGHRKIEWDAENMRVTNLEEANQYLRRQDPREGWALEGMRASR